MKNLSEINRFNYEDLCTLVNFQRVNGYAKNNFGRNAF